MCDKELINAYLKAKYVITSADKNYRLRVGQCNSELDKMLHEQGAKFAYFITPENPFSQKLTDEENRLRHERFMSEIKDKRRSFLEGYGTDENDTWQREKSYLIFCENEDELNTLAGRFGQLGILKIEINKPVTLLVLSDLHYSPAN